MDVKKDILWRVYLCFVFVIVLGFLVLGKAFYIQTVEGKYWRSKGDSLQKYIPITAERGSIYSEDGNILSTSVPVYDVIVDFRVEGLHEKNGKRFSDNIDSLCIKLHQLFEDSIKAEEYKEKLVQAFQEKDPYFVLKRKISFEEYKEMRDFPLIKDGVYKSGFTFLRKDKRINPYGLLANRTIGLSRLDSNKNVGLEKSYDSVLKGSSGVKLVRYAAGGYMPVEGGEFDPVNGKDIVTTLDTYIQDVAENALMKMLVDNNSRHGTVIVMETATGKIKAIANLGKQTDSSTIYTEDLNYGIGKSTEPGSIFKLVTLLSLLDDKYVTIDTKVDCEGGSKYFYGLRIKDSHLGTGVISLKDAFSRSSNVAFAKLATQYYQDQPMKWWEHIDRFRLNKMTGIDIVASSGRPTIKKPTSSSWQKTTIPFMAHGYEELVTPLHMLMLYNAVANNGKMMKPYLVSAVKDYGVVVKQINPEVLVEKICSDSALIQARECLRAVVDSPHGTGHIKLFDSLYSIAGKTGTAVTAMDNHGYNKGNKIYQASFIGYFPADNPKYTMAVVIQNTRKSKKIYGADVSGTVFKEVSDKIYNHFLSKPNFDKTVKLDSAQYNFIGTRSDAQLIFKHLGIQYKDSAVSGIWRNINYKSNFAGLNSPTQLSAPLNVAPDVKGMGLKDAVYLLENKGLVVVVSGKGKVVSQSVAAGSSFTKGQKILLVLN